MTYAVRDWPCEPDAPMIVRGMPDADYHGHAGSISKSGLDLVARSPAHFRYAAPRAATRNMEIGSALHTALLEPDRFVQQYVALKDAADRKKSSYREAAKVHGGAYVLTGPESDYIGSMQESFHANPAVRHILSRAQDFEASGFAIDPDTGVTVRVRWDVIAYGGVLADVKTTRDASREAFARSVHNYRYHVQAAIYSDVWEWITGEAPERFVFLCVESDPPHATMVYELDENSIDEGRRLYRRDLDRYAEALESGDWCGYDGSDEVQTLSIPAWAFGADEEEVRVITEDDEA